MVMDGVDGVDMIRMLALSLLSYSTCSTSRVQGPTDKSGRETGHRSPTLRLRMTIDVDIDKRPKSGGSEATAAEVYSTGRSGRIVRGALAIQYIVGVRTAHTEAGPRGTLITIQGSQTKLEPQSKKRRFVQDDV